MKLSGTIIVVIGGGLIKDKATGRWRSTSFSEGDNFGVDGARLRVNAAAYLYKKQPHLFFLASGGKGQLAKIPDAPPLSQVIKKELIEQDVPASRIMVEGKSGCTFEQLLNLAKLAHQKKWPHLTILSNRYHLPRIKALLAFAPRLADLLSHIKLVLLSAEEICLNYDQAKWRSVIERAYASPAMKRRIALEKKGVQDIKENRYKFK